MDGYQQRWLIREHEIFGEVGSPKIESDEPVLQFRIKERNQQCGQITYVWSEWQDVAEVTERD